MTHDEKLFPNLRYDSLVSFAKDLSVYYDFIEKITLHRAHLNNRHKIKYLMIFQLPQDPGPEGDEDLSMRLNVFKRFLEVFDGPPELALDEAFFTEVYRNKPEGYKAEWGFVTTHDDLDVLIQYVGCVFSVAQVEDQTGHKHEDTNLAILRASVKSMEQRLFESVVSNLKRKWVLFDKNHENPKKAFPWFYGDNVEGVDGELFNEISEIIEGESELDYINRKPPETALESEARARKKERIEKLKKAYLAGGGTTDDRGHGAPKLTTAESYDDEQIKKLKITRDGDNSIKLQWNKNRHLEVKVIPKYFGVSNKKVEEKMLWKLLEDGYVIADTDAEKKQIRRVDSKLKNLCEKELEWVFSPGFKLLSSERGSSEYRPVFQYHQYRSDEPKSRDELKEQLAIAVKAKDENRISFLATVGTKHDWLSKSEVTAAYDSISVMHLFDDKQGDSSEEFLEGYQSRNKP